MLGARCAVTAIIPCHIAGRARVSQCRFMLDPVGPGDHLHRLRIRPRGFVKGVIGLGLPTISMGLLATVMPPAGAAALLIVPSLVTNNNFSLAGSVVMTLAAAAAGMWLGQALRRHLSPAVFRSWFFIGLFALGLYLVARAAIH
jgi:uncharacterized membrane protein YfcA